VKANLKILSYWEGWLSIIINMLLFGLKYWAGIVTGSIAITADAWHTLTDSISSIIILIGAKVSSKPADKNHPFGHGRAELIASLIIGVLLAVIAFSFLEKSIGILKNQEKVLYGKIAIMVTIFSIILKEILAQFAFWAWRKSGSIALKADGWHHRSDAISSLIILAGIFIGKYFWWTDGVLGLVVSILIFKAAYDIFRDSISPMLGSSPDKNLMKKVKNICKQINSNTRAHHFHIHEYGNHTELTFHIYLPANIYLDEAHKISEQIEDKIRESLNIESTIHMESFETEKS